MRFSVYLLSGILALVSSSQVSSEQADNPCLKHLVSESFASALETCIELASAGDNQAGYELAQLYARGQGVKKDAEQAIRWLTPAAEAGMPDAMFNLGVAFKLGRGVAQNNQAAFDWLFKAAEAGQTKAQSLVGDLFEKGSGTRADMEQAYHWRMKAAEKAHPASQFKVGLMTLHGVGTNKNTDNGLMWIEQAANNKHEEAQFALATLLWDDSPQRALKWYQAAALNDHPKAMHNLAAIYLKGENVEQNLKKAELYARAAIKAGETNSQNILDVINQTAAEQETQLIRKSQKEYLASLQQHNNEKRSKSVDDSSVVATKESKAIKTIEQKESDLKQKAAINTDDIRNSEIASKKRLSSEVDNQKQYWRTAKWIEGLPETSYVLQLANMQQKSSISYFVQKYSHSTSLNIFETQVKDKKSYIIFSGPYKNKLQAKQALSNLASLKPWLRHSKAMKKLANVTLASAQ